MMISTQTVKVENLCWTNISLSFRKYKSPHSPQTMPLPSYPTFWFTCKKYAVSCTTKWKKSFHCSWPQMNKQETESSDGQSNSHAVREAATRRNLVSKTNAHKHRLQRWKDRNKEITLWQQQQNTTCLLLQSFPEMGAVNETKIPFVKTTDDCNK